MQPFPPTLIIRHRLENLKKCSLTGLEGRSDLVFLRYPYTTLPNLDHTIMLTLNAPELTLADAPYRLLIIDATWRYAEKMLQPLNKLPNLQYRSLPQHFRTAYPRKQEDCPDPTRGLASIEALYLSYRLLERDTTGLLNGYYWKEQFLSKNQIIN